jgi:hypothetical protein
MLIGAAWRDAGARSWKAQRRRPNPGSESQKEQPKT